MGREEIQVLEENKKQEKNFKTFKLGRKGKAEIMRGLTGRARKYICEIMNCQSKAYLKKLK